MARVMACWLATTWLLLSPSSIFAKKDLIPVQLEKGIVFGKGGSKDLKLDLARPKDEKRTYPAVVCIHGGGWIAGQRKDYSTPTPAFGKLSVIEYLAAHGYVVATIDYRLAPANRFPAQIEDCKAAVRWLRANALKYQLDPTRIGALGFSAGGHLVCLLGAAGKKDGFEGTGGNADQSSAVQAVVSFFGPTNFNYRGWRPDDEKTYLIPVLGATFKDKPELYRRLSPINYVTKKAPPYLFIHGTKDELVPLRHATEMAAKLKKVGVSAQIIEMTGEGHGWKGEKVVQSFDQSIAFFDKTLKGNKAK